MPLPRIVSTKLKRLSATLAVLLLIVAGFGAYLLQPKTADAQWYDGGWPVRKRLALNRSQISGSHTNIPILVSVTDTSLRDNAQTDGDDILFTAADGRTRLDHEIESYSSSTGALIAWVEFPTVNANDDTSIYMYYGNPGVGSQASTNGTWESTFRGVYHLADGSGTTATDRTSNSNSLTLNTASWLTSAKIAGGWNGASNNWLSRTDDNDFDFAASDNFTISMWVKSDSATNPAATQWVVNKSLSGGTQTAGYAVYFNTSGQICFGVDDDTTWNPDDQACSSSDIYDGTWRYISAVKTGTTRIEIFVNGVSAGSDASISATGTLANDRDLIIADRQASDGTDEFAGDIDELSIAATNRSSDYLLTSYNSQNDPSSFITLSSTEERMATVLNWKFDEGYGTTAADSTDSRLDGTLGASTAAPDRRSEDLCLFGKCLLFDGVNDFVSRSYSSSTDTGLDVGTDAFAVSMWFRHGDVISQNETLISRYNNGGYDLYMNTSGQICFRVAQNGTALSSGDSICTTKSFYNNNWYFVKAIWDPDDTNKQSIYITSSLEASSTSITQTGSKSGSSPTLYVGVGSDGTSNPWYGYIDDVKVYRESFEDSKMRADTASTNYSEGASAVFGDRDIRESLTNGLVGYWRFEEGSEGTCTGGTRDACDLSSARNDGEWEGTPRSDEGKFGRAINFDTNDDYISVADSSSIDVASRFTLSAWVKPSDDASPPLLIQRDGTTSTSTAQSTNSITFSHTVNTQSNQVLVLTSGIEDDGNTAISSATFNGQALTVATQVANSNRRAEIWYLLNPPVGTFNLTVTYAATVNDISVGATNLYNVAQQAPTQTATNTNDGGATTVTFTPTSDMSAVIESVVNGTPTSNTLTPTSSQTELYESTTTNALMAANFSIVNENTSTSLVVTPTTADNQAHVAAVFAPASTGSTRVLLGKGRDAYQMELSSSNTLTTYFFNSSLLTTTLTSGVWSHILVSYDSVNATLYLNGELIQSVAVNRATDTNSTALSIGQSYDGLMDDLRIYNRPFSEYEVRYFYEWGPAPLTYYSFDEGDGSVVNNRGYSSNGASLTCTGGGCSNPAWSPGKYGKSLLFSKTTGGYANLDGSGITVDSRQPFSVSFWVYVNDISNGVNENILCDTVGNRFCLRVTGNSATAGYVRLCTDNSACSSNARTNSDVITERRWHHVVFTYDGSTNFYSYVDGIDQASDLSAPSISDITANSFYIGLANESGSLVGCNCRIDDMRIYNYARTQKQVIADLNMNHPSVGGPVGGPIAYWNFDEGRSTQVYSQGNCVTVCNANLSNFSDPPTTSSGWTPEGRYDKALRFDGTNDYISIGNDYQLRIPNQITLSAWIKPEANNRTILSKWDTQGTGRSYRLFVNSSNQIAFALSSNGTNESILTSTDTIVVDGSTWYHVVVTYDGATMKLFINGQAEDTLARTGVIYEGGESVIIGGSYTSNTLGSYFDGVIDEVRIYNFALNDSETGQEYFKGATALIGTLSTNSGGVVSDDSADRSFCIPGDTSTCRAPRAFLKLNEKMGTTVNDDSGFSNSGTINGGTTAFFARGYNNNGVTFNNNNNARINLSDESPFDFTTALTFSGWWRINSWQTTSARIFTKGTSNPPYTVRRAGSTGAVEFLTRNNGTNNVLTSSTNITDGVWRYLSFVWDGTTKYIYINGQVDTSAATSGTLNTNGNTITIGEDSDTGSGTWSAQVDEVRIYDYARTPQQINWDMNRGKPASWWKFDDCSGSTAYDAGVNTSNATISIGASGTYTSAGNCNSGTATEAWVGGREGIFNSAIALDGTNDKIITDVSATVANFTQATVSAWVYPTSYNANGAKIYFEPTNGSTSNARLELVLNSTGTVTFQGRAPDGDSLTQWVTTSRTVPLNQWSHVVGIFDSISDAHYVYINKFQTTTSVTEASFTNSNPAAAPYIGAISSGVDTFNFAGRIDDVRIYPYAMTQVQVNLLFAGDGAAVFGPDNGLP